MLMGFAFFFFVFAAVSSSADVVVAHSAHGMISVADVDGWKATFALGKNGRSRDLCEVVDRIVLLRAFATAADTLPESDAERCRAEAWLAGLEVGAAALRRAEIVAAEPTVKELRARYQRYQGNFKMKAQWRLQNIFKEIPHGASPAKVAELRRQMKEIRERVQNGEDFGDIAARESDSATRSRRGRMGMVRLDDVTPEITEELSKLRGGSLSPVLSTDAGLTLLYCMAYFPERQMPFDEVRAFLKKRVKKERLEKRWAALDEVILKRIAPIYHPDSISAGSGDATPVLVCTLGEQKMKVSLARFAAFVARRGASDPAFLTHDERARQLIELALLIGRADEADRRHLLDQPLTRERSKWRTLAAQGECYARRQVANSVVDPSPDQIQAFYEAQKDRIMMPARLQVRLIKIEIAHGEPLEILHRARQAAVLLRSGEGTVEEACRLIDPSEHLVEAHDFDWRLVKDVLKFGPDIGPAIVGLDVGGVTEPIQDGQTLLIGQLLDRHEQRLLSLEEATPQIRSILRRRLEREARTQLEMSVLKLQEVKFMDQCP